MKGKYAMKQVTPLITFLFLANSILAAMVTVKDDAGAPVKDANVILVDPSGTIYKAQMTNERGEANIVSAINDIVIVLCAHDKYRAYREVGVNPSKPIEITMKKAEETGSLVFNGPTTVNIPQFKGQLNLFVGTTKSTNNIQNKMFLLCTNNGLINGKNGLSRIEVNKSILLQDRDNNRFDVTPLDLLCINRARQTHLIALIEFKKLK